MTDTGQIPGEGLPENAGMVEQPGIPAPGAYTFLDPSEHAPEDDDLLLMPASQGAWSDPQTVQPQPQPQIQAQPQPQVQAQAVPPAAPQGFPPASQAAPAAPQAVQPEGAQAAPAAAAAEAVPAPVPAPEADPAAAAAPEAVSAPEAQAPAVSSVPEQQLPDGQQPPYATQPQVPAQGQEAGLPAEPHGTHESGGRDTGSVDLNGVRVPPPAPAPVQAPAPVGAPAQAPAPARRPLHRGPAEAPSYGGGTQGGGVVRSLADRGPAGAVRTAPAARHASPPVAAPDSFAAPAEVLTEEAPLLPGPQLGEIPPQGAAPWGPPPQQPQAGPEAAAEAPVESVEPVPVPVVEAQPEVEAEPEAQVEPEPVAEQAVEAEAPAEPVQPEAPAEPEAAAAEVVAPAGPEQPVEVEQRLEESAVEPEAVVEPEAEVQPEVVAEPEPVQQTAPEETAPAESAPAETVVPEAPAAETPAEAAVPTELPAEAPVETPEAQSVPADEAIPEPPAPAAEESAQPEAATETPEAAPETSEAPEAEAAPAPQAVESVEPVVPVEEAPAPVAPVVQAAAAEPAPQPEEAPEAVQAPEAPTELVEPTPAPAATAPTSIPEPDAEDGTGPEVIETPELDEEPVEQPVAEAAPEEPFTPPAPGYDDAEREAVLRVMRERRDIRNGFRSDPIPHEVLLRVLEAAHTAPSVGHSQPWDFVVIRSAETRRSMHELAQRQREAYAKSLPKGRAKQFKELKIEAILDTPVNIVVTADPTRGGRHTLGRHTQPQMAPYSSALAVENLWLAARAEGLGVGWVSFFDEREMVRALGLPEHLEVVAYLCVGYVDEFPEEPELMQAGWSKRRPLSWVVHEETYGRRALPGEEPHDLLQETISAIRPLDAKALGEAWERQKRMTKPAGALGMLEIISAQLSGLSRMCPPPIPEPAAVAIFAGDHGVHAQGVTAWPQEVTAQMVANFLGGGAVCNAFAAQVGAEVCVVDVGVATDLPATPGLLPRKVRKGTADFTTGPALTREDVLAAIEVGIETARDLVAAGNKALLTGEMGIANTTASAALICVYTGIDASEVTGRGTGINDEMHARKVDVVRRALDLHQPDPADPIGVLAAVGGLEHAAMVGFLLGGASLRTPVVLDGVSAGAAALVARAIAPEALAACIAGHRSAEPGHVAALNKLGLRPLVDLDLRLGEGTGALLALPIVQSAARAMHEVATFDAAGVTEK
ncbi:nicotinate-nucleotide--dimethylbenzimidazole phosphoribosyltransferase [Streptomyces sp. CFMR 7]|uniref:nicotinate-nucleotide--dimethylbenzimidazole phosphoribosyltransferase n=1 Tax=Streptomyces sp. CFMR 7 TaxID=1649184 RepID=UPI0011A38096|nr:nicotinate-nucleotide--dimethylbenzimidazole phosphoribosyltransferase [Streptomyces sp. CFMR 7]